MIELDSIPCLVCGDMLDPDTTLTEGEMICAPCWQWAYNGTIWESAAYYMNEEE